jgi:cysteine-rich repeat protein
MRYVRTSRTWLLAMTVASVATGRALAEGWVANSPSIAKYVNAAAPTNGAVKLAIIKPGSLLKVVAASMGDFPLNISAAPTQSVYVMQTIVNGGQRSHFCTTFTGCVHRSLDNGTGYRLVCNTSSPGGAACLPDDIPITGHKLVIVDRRAAAGKAKVTFVAKDPAITTGATMSSAVRLAAESLPSDIMGTLTISYDDASGLFAMPEIPGKTPTLWCFKDADDDGAHGLDLVRTADADCNDRFEGWLDDPPDCDDTNPSIHPAAVELPGDEIDQDCDGHELCFRDADGDGYRPDAVSTVLSADTDCSDPGEASAANPIGDCDDTDAAVHPGATELCNGRDDDCDGVMEAVDCGTTCHPGAAELPGDEFDQNCDGRELCFRDADGDGYRPDAVSTVLSADTDCSDPGEASAANPIGDCDDTNAGIHPGAVELPDDGIDQDCDGRELCFRDTDGDGYRPDAVSTIESADTDCSDPGEASATEPVGDCDDSDPNRRPNAVETCNGKDDNCDGAIDGATVCTPGLCGDGIVSAGEECDDANLVSTDGCSRSCGVEVGWSCTGMPSLCTTTCGDGIVAQNEQCDDGNNAVGDGCSQDCRGEPGWDCRAGESECLRRPAERCDQTFCNDGCAIVGSSSGAWLLALPPIWILAARRRRR